MQAETPSQNDLAVQLRGISKKYGSGRALTHVLENVNLEIERGEFVAIVGFSGAGKTTLVSILAGLIQADQGTVLVNGRESRGPGPDRGVVFQNYSLLPWLSAYENVRLAIDQVFPKLSAAERGAKAEEYLRMVNLGAARDKKPAELSGGMRQRVAVARALAMDPDVLVMDEPLSALDALTRATLQTEIERIWRQSRKTVVLVTNDVDEALLLADRIVPLSAGPNATLGPSFYVDIERPRERTAINHHPRFKVIRAEVIQYLLDSSAERRNKRKLPEPETAAESAVEIPSQKYETA